MLNNHFAAIWILSIFIGIGFVTPSIAEMPPVSNGASQSSLPHCVNAESDIATIQGIQREIQKANPKTARKYDGYRDTLHTDTNLVLAARLAYAETAAANCPEQNDQILDLIAAVIGNRIRVRGGDVKSVVFQKDQFASSLNIYPESRYRDFLCPSNDDLWSKALTKMQANLEQLRPSAPIPKDSVNYYLYRHSDRFKAPAWKLEEVPIADEKIRECIRVFRDPAWK